MNASSPAHTASNLLALCLSLCLGAGSCGFLGDGEQQPEAHGTELDEHDDHAKHDDHDDHDGHEVGKHDDHEADKHDHDGHDDHAKHDDHDDHNHEADKHDHDDHDDHEVGKHDDHEADKHDHDDHDDHAKHNHEDHDDHDHTKHGHANHDHTQSTPVPPKPLIFRDEEPDVSKLPEALGKLVGREDLDAESLHPHARVLYPGQPDRDARAIIRPERQALSYITLEIDVNTALVSDSGKAALVVLDVRRIHAPTKRVLSKGQMLEVWQHQERWTLFRRLYIRKAVRAAYVRPFGWLDHSEPQAEGVHAIRDAAALSAAAWTARDLAGAMAVWADDATRTTLSTVPQEVQREAIAEDYRTAFKRPAWITAAWAFEEINVLDGDVAVTLSRLSRSSPGRQVTRPTTLRRLDVWQKEPAKPWRIVRSVQYPIL